MTADIPQIALVGFPNVGKTYLFNRLTGCSRCVGNWSGVTVSACHRQSSCQTTPYEFIDLPGIQHLDTESALSLDALHTLNALQKKPPQFILNVIHTGHLAEQLNLTYQLMTLQIPMLVVLNYLDLYALPESSRAQLAQHLDTQVVCISAKSAQGLFELNNALLQLRSEPYQQPRMLEQLRHHMHLPTWHNPLQRYAYFHQYTASLLQQLAEPLPSAGSDHTQESIDRWVLHPIVGLVLLTLLLYTLLWLTMTLGQICQDALTPILQHMAYDTGVQLRSVGLPHPLVSILFDQGIVQGSLIALGFFPVLWMMYFLLGWLEESGYMARIAVIFDALFQRLGLTGHASLAPVLSIGCNVPGIMATQNLPCARQRLITIMMLPFVSCSARMGIFVAFTHSFFPHQGALILGGIWGISLAASWLTATILHHWLPSSPQQASHAIIHLPRYQQPNFYVLTTYAWRHSKRFVWRAGQWLIPTCMAISFLAQIDTHGSLQSTLPVQHSLLASGISHILWIFQPMGLTQEHWPLVVGLFTGLIAKEALLSGIASTITLDSTPALFPGYLTQLQEAFLTLLDRLVHLPQDWWSVSLATSTDSTALLHQSWHLSFAQGLAYLIFVALYFPCASTLIAIAQQLGRSWAFASLLWTCILAYTVAVLVYQLLSSYSPLLSLAALSLLPLLAWIAAALYRLKVPRTYSGIADPS